MSSAENKRLECSLLKCKTSIRLPPPKVWDSLQKRAWKDSMSQWQWKTQGHSVLGHNRATARMDSQQLRRTSKTLTSSSQTKSQLGEGMRVWNPTLYKELLATRSGQKRENPFSLRARLLVGRPCSRGRLQFKRIRAAPAVLRVLNKQKTKNRTRSWMSRGKGGLEGSERRWV